MKASRFIFLAPLALFAGLLFYFAQGLKRDPSAIPTTLLDQPVPEFELPPIEGFERGLSSDDLKGEVMLLNIFGSWCIGCQIEHPLLTELAEANAIPIMGIDWKDPPGAGTKWLETHGNPYTLIGDDANGRIAIDFGVTGAPETFIIDKNGRIRYKYAGPITPQIWREDFEPIITELRNEQDEGADRSAGGVVSADNTGAGG